MGHLLWKRQDDTFSTNGNNVIDDDDSWWGYNPTADGIKWAIVGAVLLILWLVGGYFHAQRRIKRGQAPLAYHRVRMRMLWVQKMLIMLPSSWFEVAIELVSPLRPNSHIITNPCTPRSTRCNPVLLTLIHLQVSSLLKLYSRLLLTSLAYNAAHSAPPVYTPPAGSSKINPDQGYVAPPPGPPPGPSDSGESSSAMQSVPLNPGPPTSDNQAACSQSEDKRSSFAARLNPFKGGSSSK